MRTKLCPIALTLAALAVPVPAAAQSDPNTHRWAHASQIGAFVAGSTGSGTGVTLGGTAGWEISHWTTIEARGNWFDRGPGADAFSATIGALVNIVPRNTLTPFVAAGYGLHHASFDPNTASVPPFYSERTNGGTTHSFTDPALQLGAGMDAIVRGRWSVRPEVSTLIVRGGGRTEAFGTFGVRVGYRFEDRPVTPRRASP
jgi:hypothetical protein